MIDEINTNIEKVADYYDISYYPVYNTGGNIMYENTTNYCIFVTASDSGWQANSIGAFFPQNATLQPTYNGSQFLNNITTTIYRTNSNTQVGVGDWSVTKSAKFKYMYTQFNWASSTGFNYVAGEEYGATILSVPPFSITTTLEDVTINSDLYKALKVNYSSNLLYIGTLEGVPEDVHFINISLSYVGSDLIAFNTKELYNNTNTSTILIVDNDYNIYVASRVLELNLPVVLYVDCFIDSTFEDDVANAELRLFTLRNNATIENGSVINFGSGEGYSIQNGINDLIDSNNNDINNILDNSEVVGITNSLFGNSGDTSGDFYNTFGYVTYDNPYSDFITRIFYDITNVLTSTGNVSYTLGYHDDDSLTLHSDDFILPNGPIKFFLSSCITFFIVYKIYGKMKYYIDSLMEGDLLYTLEWRDGQLNEYIFF